MPGEGVNAPKSEFQTAAAGGELLKIKTFMHHDFHYTLCAIILAGLCLGLFFSTLNNTFVYTDSSLLLRAADQPKSVNPYSGAAAEDDTHNGWDAANPLVPMTALSQEKQILKMRPFGYHLIQLCIHFFCGLALFALSLNILKRPEPRGPAIPRPELYAVSAAALFLCHPVSAANVSWISAQKELLAALCLLAATAFFMSDTLRAKQSVSLFYALSVLFYALAVLSGPATALWCLALCVQARFAVPGAANRVERMGRGAKLIPFAALSLISWYILAQDKSGAFHAGAGLNAASDYLRGALLPFGLSPVLRHTASHQGFSMSAAMGAGALVLAFLLWVFSLVFRRFFISGLFAAVFLSVTIPNTFAFHDYMTDARPYLISILIPLLFLAVSRLSTISARTRPVILLFTVALICLYSFFSVKTFRVFQNDATFWTAIVKSYPGEGQSWYMLGLRHTISGDYPRAERALKKSISIEPKNPRFHYGLGRYYLQARLPEKAGRKFMDAYNISPERNEVRGILWQWFYEVGYQLLKMKKYEAAKRNFVITIQLNPAYEFAHTALAYIHQEQGDYYSAYAEMAIAAELAPDNDDIRKSRDFVLKKARENGYQFEIKGITKPFFDNLRKKKASGDPSY